MTNEKTPDSAASALSAGLEGAECGARALEILEALARLAADGKSITIAEDWGFGTATVIDQDGAHSHVGVDCTGSEQEDLRAFVSQLHSLLVGKHGLSWAKPSNVQGDRRCAASSRSVRVDRRVGRQCQGQLFNCQT